MCAVDSFYECAPTHYDDKGLHSSHPDHAIIPISLRSHVTACEVWLKTGKAMQMITDAHLRDHMPMVIKMEVLPAATTARKKEHTWDRDALSPCLTEQ